MLEVGDVLSSIVDTPTCDNHRAGGCTALHYACQVGNAGSVELLLAFGANPNTKKKNGSTPFTSTVFSFATGAGIPLPPDLADFSNLATVATESDFLDYALLLLEAGAQVNEGDNEFDAVLACVAHAHQSPDKALPILLLLLEFGSISNTICTLPGCPSGCTALHSALLKGHVQCAEVLVLAGWDVNAICT